jgi:DNA-binding beta-propeller fold protein YncE
MNIIKKTISAIVTATCAVLVIAPGIFCPAPLQGQVSPPKFEVDPYWPKPLPNGWVNGWVGGACVDAKDHVFVIDRQNLTDNEKLAGHPAPPVTDFDPEGNVVNSWGDPEVVPIWQHPCYVDYENNVWLTGSKDGIVQKYTHDGSKLLLQIGKSRVFDTSDGTYDGRALNSSHTLLNRPTEVAVDRSTGDIYISDGYGNSRVVVFDRDGKFLRQWGRQGTSAEAEAGEGGAFMQVVHCLQIGNDGLVYVCDRQGDRVQVFDKMGNFKRNIWIRTGSEHLPDRGGTAMAVGFSPDPAQRFMYVASEHNDRVYILDHATGQILSSFGRVGHLLGEFTHAHGLAVDSKGNIYVSEVQNGNRVQKFKIVSSQ